MEVADKAGQAAPPAKAGVITVRVRLEVPGPQEDEHVELEDQDDTTQSTARFFVGAVRSTIQVRYIGVALPEGISAQRI